MNADYCLINQTACGRIQGDPVCPKCGMDERVVYPGQADMNDALQAARSRYAAANTPAPITEPLGPEPRLLAEPTQPGSDRLSYRETCPEEHRATGTTRRSHRMLLWVWAGGAFVLLATTIALWTLLGRGGESAATQTSAASSTDTAHSTHMQGAGLAAADAAWTATPVLQWRDVKFRVFVTSSDLSFDYAQVDRLNFAGKPADLVDTLLTPVFVRDMGACKAMVVLGTASQEGDATVESIRALQRAQHVQYSMWASAQLDSACALYTLNLGQARPAVAATGIDPQATAHQRRLMVVSVLEAEDATLREVARLRDSLHHVLGEMQGLPVNPVRDYMAFDLKREH